MTNFSEETEMWLIQLFERENNSVGEVERLTSALTKRTRDELTSYMSNKYDPRENFEGLFIEKKFLDRIGDWSEYDYEEYVVNDYLTFCSWIKLQNKDYYRISLRSTNVLFNIQDLSRFYQSHINPRDRHLVVLEPGLELFIEE